MQETFTMQGLLLAIEKPAVIVAHDRPDIALVPEMPVADALRFIMAECRALIDKQRTILFGKR